ncbi:helix-turn-helix domain-containing protein, partial [Shinella sp.]
MQIGRVTTPHGRPMTLALVKGQLETADRGPSKAVNKWKVFNDIGETKDSFALQDRSITVLQALL